MIPRFQVLFEGFNAPLPLITRVIVGISDAIRHDGIFVLAGLAVVFFLVQRWFAKESSRRQWEAWTRTRGAFNAALARQDPATMKAAWQRFYFRGELPEETDAKPVDHVTRRRLAEPKS